MPNPDNGTDIEDDEKPAAGGTPADTGTDQGNPNPPDPDYKAKFAASTAENQRLMAEQAEKDRKIAEFEAERAKGAPSQITPSADPIEQELRREHPDWETFNPVTQQALRKQHVTDRRLAELEAERKWEKEIAALGKSEQFKDLGSDPDFEKFALKPENRNTPLTTLAAAYKFQQGPAPATPPPAEPASPEGALPRSSGGPRGEQLNQGKKYKATELAKLRETDERAWREITMAPGFDPIDDVLEE